MLQFCEWNEFNAVNDTLSFSNDISSLSQYATAAAIFAGQNIHTWFKQRHESNQEKKLVNIYSQQFIYKMNDKTH